MISFDRLGRQMKTSRTDTQSVDILDQDDEWCQCTFDLAYNRDTESEPDSMALVLNFPVYRKLIQVAAMRKHYYGVYRGLPREIVGRVALPHGLPVRVEWIKPMFQ